MIEIIFVLLMLALSLALLVTGADFLVDGAADFARYLKVSPILVGLTVVAFGTSLPEFIVSLFAGIGGKADLSIGNIIGSNIANIGLIIGISAVIYPLLIQANTLLYEFPFLLISTFLLLILGNDFFIYGRNTLTLDRIDGIIFLLIFTLFLAYVYYAGKRDKKKITQEFAKEYQNKNSLGKNSLLIIGGLVGLILGGRIFVYYASELARLAGLSEAFIGLTIAAVGTSLPELATSAVAAWKKQADIAIGNIVGSNIFNILFILGIVSLISPLSLSPAMLSLDGMVMIGFFTLFLFFSAKDKKIGRREGLIFLILYLTYIGYLIWGL